MSRWFRNSNDPRRYPASRMFSIALVLVFLVFSLFPYTSQGKNIPLKNQLADSSSPYLRDAATSLVHWQLWGEQAFRLAKELDRPVLLDIGAIWCHWCHVMDEKTYGNAEVAKFINENFIPIKVDRDARPDIDERFQLIVSTLSKHGGWPLTAFLTPSGLVFFGGGTFLPEARFGRPGFKTLLPRIVEIYQKDKEKLTANAKEIYKAIKSNLAGSLQNSPLSQDLVDLIQEDIVNRSDPIYGGIRGTRSQFPRAPVLILAMELYAKNGRSDLRNHVETTLNAMAKGGIRDQLGGGFHRYTTDHLWIVPHFEQMDYVQSQLLRTYALAYQLTGKPLYREVIENIIHYVNRILLDPKEGGFYAHKDADMEPGDDGGYFTWTVEEVKKSLSPMQAEVMLRYFDIGVKGEMREDPKKNVLWVAKLPDEIAKELGISEEKVKELIRVGKSRLLDVRNKRKNPFVDKTRYAGRSALMVTGYLEAYKALGDEKLKQTALKSLTFIWKNLYRPSEGIYHAFMENKAHPPYLLSDQVLVSQALLNAFEVTGEIQYVNRAQVLMDLAIQRLWDDELGGFFDKISQQGEISALNLPMKIYQDKEMPGPNAVAVLVLDRLHDLTNKKIYREKAKATLAEFAGAVSRYGMFAATYGQALSRHMNHPPQVVIIGATENPRTHELWGTALKTFRPGKFVSVYDPKKVDLNSLPPAVQSAARIGMKDGIPKAYVCVGDICALPTSSSELVAKLIRTM